MSFGVTRIGATSPTSAYAVAERARANAEQARSAAQAMRAEAHRHIEPAGQLIETPAQIRNQVMSERGLDRLDLLRMGPQARLQAEVSITAEAAERARRLQAGQPGVFVDLSV